MKKILILFNLMFLSSLAFAQVGIGTSTPTTTLEVVGKPTVSTVLDGITVPKLTCQQVNTKHLVTGYNAAQTGTVLYITNVGTVATCPPTSPPVSTVNAGGVGFYAFDGTEFRKVSIGAPATGTLVVNRIGAGSLVAQATPGVYRVNEPATPTNPLLPIVATYENNDGTVVSATIHSRNPGVSFDVIFASPIAPGGFLNYVIASPNTPTIGSSASAVDVSKGTVGASSQIITITDPLAQTTSVITVAYRNDTTNEIISHSIGEKNNGTFEVLLAAIPSAGGFIDYVIAN